MSIPELTAGFFRCSPRSTPVLFAAMWSLMGFARIQAAEPMIDINVNVTLTEEGKKIPRPTREHPAYYYPIMARHTEEGLPVAGDKLPPPVSVARLLAKALAQQGYLVTVSDKSPTLVLVFHWGRLTVDEDKGSGSPGSETEQVVGASASWQTESNKNLRMAMVGGTGHEVDVIGRPTVLSHEDADAIEDASDDRYFVLVSAYDAEAYRTQKKKLLLWQARMSVPMPRADSFAQVMTTLIDTGAPFFGRETLPPARLKVPVMPKGKVEIGTPTVVPSTDPTQPKKTP